MDKNKSWDFCGWVTKNNIKCSDNRIIRHGAFKDDNGNTVPLVWNHDHKNPTNILGNVLLEHRDKGVYGYATFNETEDAKTAKELVLHGDITHMSIYANKLKQVGNDVVHGVIREVSLVLAGANPGATIETVIAHSDDSDEEAIIQIIEEPISTDDENLEHSADKQETKKSEKEENLKMEGENTNNEKTVKDVVDGMNEEQKNVMYHLIGAAKKTGYDEAMAEVKEQKGGNENMKHNAFDDADPNTADIYESDPDELVHSALNEALDAVKNRKSGSFKEALKESLETHKEEFMAHGIDNIEYLYPDAKNITNGVGFVLNKPKEWVNIVMDGVHHTPFSRVKMMFADLRSEDVRTRAKGYAEKGKYKYEEVFTLFKRTITPTRVYKKQKLDKDDLDDIVDFDVAAMVAQEMRIKLDEELARAFIFGDGRQIGDDDKISEEHIIPVAKDTVDDVYAMKVPVSPVSGETVGHAFVQAAVKGMDKYEGSGNVTAFVRQDMVSDLILEEDKIGRRLYEDVNDLAKKMRFNRIVEVPPVYFTNPNLVCVALDLSDYNVGADKGGKIDFMNDFDIDYNQMKYLLETRCSAGLTQVHSALVFEKSTSNAPVEAVNNNKKWGN